MKKELALKLQKKAEEIAFNFSGENRQYNYSKESFKVKSIHPLSESTAYVIFEKSSGKIGLAFLYWIKMSGGYWQYFFPTYDHCVGMERIKDALHKVEIHNFPKNFIDKESKENDTKYI